MLSKTVCEKIWHCHREIETSEKLLAEVEECIKRNKEKYHTRQHEEKLKDVFGCERHLELGIPSGENSRRLFRLSYELAAPVIRAHMANKQAELAELNEMAALEISIPI